METVGFIGLGNMGGGMAGNIQKAGYPMVVYDLREEATRPFLEAGARLGSSPADVAERCDVTLTSLPGPREVELVATGTEGILEGIKPGSIYIDLSTSRPTLIRELEVQVPRQGRPRPRRSGKRRQERRPVPQPGRDGRRRTRDLRPRQAPPGRLRRQGVLRRRGRRGLRSQAGAQHDWSRRAAGHRRRPDPRRQGRRRPRATVGVRAPRLAGPHERAARGRRSHPVPGRVRPAQLRAGTGPKGHWTSHRTSAESSTSPCPWPTSPSR